MQWIDQFIPRALTRQRMEYHESALGCYPDPFSTVTIHLPTEITKDFFKDPVSYTDCAECCLLRFVQLSLLESSLEVDKASGEKGIYPSIKLDRMAKLGADAELVDYFQVFPEVLPQDLTSLEARSAWAALVTQRAGCAYVRQGGFEMNAGMGNFLAVLKSLFPPLPIPEESQGAQMMVVL